MILPIPNRKVGMNLDERDWFDFAVSLMPFLVGEKGLVNYISLIPKEIIMMASKDLILFCASYCGSMLLLGIFVINTK